MTGTKRRAVLWCATMMVGATVSVRGDMEFPPVGNGEGLDVLVTTMEIMEQCEIDVDKLAEQVTGTMMLDDGLNSGYGGNSNGPDDVFEQIAELFPDFCADNQARDFESVLGDFATCSGFDLVQAMETLGDGLIGGLMECTIAMIPVVQQTMRAMNPNPNLAVTSQNQDFGIEIPDRCLDSFLGPHPLGDMLRTMFLKPEQTMACFRDLGSKGSIPHCTYDRVWPVPLVGPILEKTACMLGAATPLLEMAVTQELTTLQSCLPQPGESITDCQTIPLTCTMMGLGFSANPQAPSGMMALPKPLLGAPLPQIFDRLAEEQGLKGAIEQYNQFVSQCITHPWDGWYATTAPDFVSPGKAKAAAAAEEAADAAAAAQQKQSGGGTEENPALKSSQNAQAIEAKTSERSGGGSGFWGGLLTGFCLMGAMWGYMIYSGNSRNAVATGTYPGATPYQSVEMVPNDLALS